MLETVSYRAPDYDDMKPHLWTFFQAVRSRKPVVADAVFGHPRPWRVICRMSRIFARVLCLGTRSPKASRTDPSRRAHLR